MIVKVKEPLPAEFDLIQEGQILLLISILFFYRTHKAMIERNLYRL